MSTQPRTCEGPHVFTAWTNAMRSDVVPRLMRTCTVCETVEWEDDPYIAPLDYEY